MKFAKYWEKVDTRLSKEVFGQSVVSVWGASNESEAKARINAEDRARKFREFADSGFDKNAEYEYWMGFVKEEIVDEIRSRDDSVLAIITRNSYGATVLNSESVLFGDIDLPAPNWTDSILGMFGKKKKDKDYFLDQIANYHKNNPSMSIRVYETFAGLRFVVTNASFNPEDTFVTEIFDSLCVDPLYMRLCKQQTCFRARLTPKPWRIGLKRPGSRFPRDNKDQQNEFDSWLGKYSHASSKKTAAKLLKCFGSARIPRDVQKVIEVHDRIACKNNAELA